MALQAGQMAGDYEVLGLLGKGGMGRVYRVRNVISDRIEAMKVLLEDVNSDPAISDRFIVEIRTLARLDHPGIAKFYAAFHLHNQLLMVMEYVEGIDLAESAREAAIPLPEVIGYIKQVLAALSYAHKRGVVHRDIKPSNIMVSSQGEVKLMDFGIAKSNTEPRLTRTGATMGSIHYMSPEQVRGDGVDARSDLYSLGIVLYELTAGCCPFDGTSTYAILNGQLNKPPRPPIELNRSLPSWLNEVILTALRKEPGDRFQDALAFFRALESGGAQHTPAEDKPGKTRFVSDSEAQIIGPPPPPPPPPQIYAPDSTPVAPPPPPPVQPVTPLVLPVEFPKKATEPPPRPRRRLALLAIGCVCAIGVVLIASYLLTRRPPPEPRPQPEPEQVAHNNPPSVVPSSPPPSSTLPDLSPSNFPALAPEKRTDNGDNQPASKPPATTPTPRTPKKSTEPQLPPQPKPAPPEEHFSRPGVTFGGDRDVISPGQSITLRWSVTDATRVQILPGFPALAPAGTVTVSPAENTQYTLLAEGPGGTATKQFSVRIRDLSHTTRAGLSIVSFAADRQSILLGTSASLHWSVQGAARVMITPGVGIVTPSGAISVTPRRSTRYVLVASAADGSSIAQTVTVSVSAQQ